MNAQRAAQVEAFNNRARAGKRTIVIFDTPEDYDAAYAHCRDNGLYLDGCVHAHKLDYARGILQEGKHIDQVVIAGPDLLPLGELLSLLFCCSGVRVILLGQCNLVRRALIAVLT
jgi:hypothetical protein